MTTHDDVTVSVQGKDAATVNAVTSVIHKSLADTGFKNVETLSADTGEPVGAGNVTSMLDLAKASNPNLFDINIQIQGSNGSIDMSPSSEDEEPGPEDDPIDIPEPGEIEEHAVPE